METYVCGRRFAIKESAVNAIIIMEQTPFIKVSGNNEGFQVEPYSPDQLLELVLKSGIPFERMMLIDNARTPDYQSVIYMIKDERGNLKLCHGNEFIFARLQLEDDASFERRFYDWINGSPIIGNFNTKLDNKYYTL